MAKNHFSVVDIAVCFVSLITFILDVSTDILVCVQLLLDGQQIWGWLTVTFVTVPAILTSVFSLTWHIHDKTVTVPVVVSHLLLTAPAQRYINVIRLGIQSYKSQKVVSTQRALRAQSDVSILRLIEAFLESAPQLVLQLYILVYQRGGDWFTGVSAGCSLVSMTWAMTAYCDSQRRAHSISYQRRLVGLLLHWGWQLFMAVGRIAAFVFFACVLHNWVLVFMGGHWLIAFICISVRGTDFGTACCEKWMFRLVCAFIYIFVFLNLNDGSSKLRITGYYILMLLENAGMVVVFIVLGDRSDMILVACAVVFGGFFIGLLCMIIYYSFLHPSGSNNRLKRFMQRKTTRTFNVSNSPVIGAGPQIFSIESPSPVTVIEVSPVDLSSNTSSSHSSSANTQHTWVNDRSSGSSQTRVHSGNLSKQTLQLAWQSGMEFSSGSSSTSSLASVGKHVSMEKRRPSVKSDNSHDSASSDNHLLPSALKRNDLSKSPKQRSKVGVKDRYYLKKETAEDVSESDNLNVHSSGSRSPTLSRGSWARSSDNMQSVILGDFTVLGFDDSSSVDRRTSDCSSFSSQMKSLSPLNVSGLWKDVHSRLRTAIVATIAAATGNPSSNEGTPNRSQSISSYNSAGQEDSLNLTHSNTSSLNHNTAFMDSGSSFQEKVDTPHKSSKQDSSRQREALSSLSDISETADLEQALNTVDAESSFEKSAKTPALGVFSPLEFSDAENKTVTPGAISRFSKECDSPFPRDSTLTASKLELKKTSSYLASRRRPQPDLMNQGQSNSPLDLSLKTPPKLLAKSQEKEEREHKGDSPFTDEELVSVMAKSLRSYMGGTSSIDTNNPEREGLALTLEDLQFSRETTPDKGSPFAEEADLTWKNRSASSLFHDSAESSPVSSASKMNRAASIQQAEDKLSPNALKHLGDVPQELVHQSISSKDYSNDGSVSHIPESLALKFIVESYGSTALKSPHPTTPGSQKSFHFTNSSANSPTKRTSAHIVSPLAGSHIQRRASEIYPKGNEHSVCFEVHGKDHLPVESVLPNRKMKANPVDSLPSNRSNLGSRIHRITDQNKPSHVRSGISATKKLNVHFSNFPILEYKSSPYTLKNREARSDTGSEVEGYVAGQYCPPLCGSDLEEESRYRNSNYKHSGAEKRKRTVDRTLNDTDLDMLETLRKEIIMKDSEQRKRQSDFFHLQDPSHADSRFCSSRSQPNLQYHSPVYQYRDNDEEFTTSHRKRSDKDRRNSSYSSYDKHKAKSFGQRFDLEGLTEDELNISAKHVTDYFSEALETPSESPGRQGKPKKHHSQPHLSVHSQRRQPLQRLENSSLMSPELANNSMQSPQNRDKEFYDAAVSKYKGPLSPIESECRPGHVSWKHNLCSDLEDLPKQRLLFESGSQKSGMLASRPPAHKSDRSANKTQYTSSNRDRDSNKRTRQNSSRDNSFIFLD